MDLHFIVGLIAWTRGEHKACLQQAQAVADCGFLPAALAMTAMTELTFAPVLAVQEAFVAMVDRSASSFH